MSATGPKRDLVVLAADKNIEAAVRALLIRHQSLGIPPIRFESYVHPGRDPGCLKRAHEFLRAQSSDFEYALVLLDREGCGSPESASQLESEIETRMSQSGWNDRARAVVIDPELEIWVWSDSPHVDSALGWAGRLPGLRDWLSGEGHWNRGDAKPGDPKCALEAALWHARIPRSSAVFAKLASTVSFQRCQDRAFLKLRQTLSAWFPAV